MIDFNCFLIKKKKKGAEYPHNLQNVKPIKFRKLYQVILNIPQVIVTYISVTFLN